MTFWATCLKSPHLTEVFRTSLKNGVVKVMELMYSGMWPPALLLTYVFVDGGWC